MEGTEKTLLGAGHALPDLAALEQLRSRVRGAGVSYMFTFTSLSPSDVTVTGTPGGVSTRRQPPMWMKAADGVEVRIPGVGRLANHIVDEV